MNVTLEELELINNAQISILREIVSVCDRLKIYFFMVHGSLLGTIRNEHFVPYDDDIDIAIPRKQYDRFLREAQSIMKKYYFVQSDLSDPNYPMEFAKVRDSRTTYIVNSVRNIDINHGIYVDIFPIDYCLNGGIQSKWLDFRIRFLNLRVASIFYCEKKSVSQRVKKFFSFILCPSWKKAVSKRNDLLKSVSDSNFVRVTGGKPAEKVIPKEWFSKQERKYFEGVPVYVPTEYDKYLTLIYGDYSSRSLVEGKMAESDKVELNAYIVDPYIPYTHYIHSKF